MVKMLKFNNDIKFYLSLQAIDARKSIDGLSALILDAFGENPQCGHLFIFFNKSRDKIKILWWSKNGFILCYKRLEKRKFIIPKLIGEINLELTQEQLEGLLAGFDFSLMQQFPKINYYQYV